jgi:hypothetical protein
MDTWGHGSRLNRIHHQINYTVNIEVSRYVIISEHENRPIESFKWISKNNNIAIFSCNKRLDSQA